MMHGRHWNEECGVIGVVADPEAAHTLFLGLYALQHRGQEACGIVTCESETAAAPAFHVHKALGLVADGINRDVLQRLPGACGIGHVRYSTQGGRSLQNVQPFLVTTSVGPITMAHNGNITNATQLRRELEAQGSIFQSTSDTEIIIHLFARAQGSVEERLVAALRVLRGAFSLVVLTATHLFAARDAFGFRPLVLGRKKNGALCAASETCALDLVGATLEREVSRGELVSLDVAGREIRSREILDAHNSSPSAACSFEPIYFARPDSRISGGQDIYHLRRRLGIELAREAPAPDADIVIAVPDSGVPMAMGYADEARLPLELGLVRNHYVGRTFIEPSQSVRDFGVRLKLNPVRSVLAGKRVVVVDDSIVRGTTCSKIIRLIREGGAAEVHFRVGSPPITHSCFYGVDTPERSRLLAAQRDIRGIRESIGADTLGYLSHEGLRRALQDTGERPQYCYACFSGKYSEDVGRPIESAPTDASGGPGLTSGL